MPPPDDLRKILEHQEKVLEEIGKLQKKTDWWARLPAITGLLSMLLVFWVGYSANRLTNVYKESEALARTEMNQHTTQTQNLQVLAQFVPLLTSDDPARQRIAVRGMYHMGGASLLRMALLGVKELPKAVECESLALTRDSSVPLADQLLIARTRQEILRLEPVREGEVVRSDSTPKGRNGGFAPTQGALSVVDPCG